MAALGYTRLSHNLREAGFRTKRYQEVKRPKSRNSIAPAAHIPQGMFAKESLCGKYLAEIIEVEYETNVKVCKVCQARVRSLFQRLPGCTLLQEIFGNKLLPAGDY